MKSSLVAQLIKKARKDRGITQEELAERCNVPRSTLASWESCVNEPSIEMIKTIAKALQIHPVKLVFDDETLDLLYDPDNPDEAFIEGVNHYNLKHGLLPSNVVPIAKLPRHTVPVIGEVAAGQPILCEETYDLYIDGPEQADFALKVKGDSMNPTYLDGDIVYIKKMPDVPNGTVAVVLLEDSATLKHVYVKGHTLTLISDNPMYAPLVYNLKKVDYVSVLGVVCGYTRIYRRA